MNTLGMLAEREAARYFLKQKYVLVSHNYSSRFGEIDLIFKKKNRFSKNGYIVFVEVKMRDVDSIAQPKEFVDASKQQKIIMTAKDYLMKNPTSYQPRFDVAEVFYENNSIKSINHLENAFTLD
ncbi:MAG: YraN family protein [Eubacterium sp.]|nr:YraN family protein [Eubacterium sp.]